MAFALAGNDLSFALVTLPRWGVWTADVELVSAVALSGPVELVIGDVHLQGHVVDGGSYVYSSSYAIAGGAGGWAKKVPARAYRHDGGIPLSQVANDLAAEVGEQLVLEAGVEDRDLGQAWGRMGDGAAVDELNILAGQAWWISPDGVTHLGPRPVVPVPSSVRFVAEDFRPARRLARITSPDDTLSPFLPGGQWTAEEVPGVQVVSSAVIVVDNSNVWMEVRGV
jgi:hypothetical protein